MLFRVLIILFSFIFIPASVWGSTYVPLDDEVYLYLERLEAEGIIKSGLLTTRPLSYKEVARLVLEAERNSIGRGPYIKSIIDDLKKRFIDEAKGRRFVKPVERFYILYKYQNTDNQALNYNLEGDTFSRGSNLRAGMETRVEWGWIGLSLRPEFRYSEGSDIYWRGLYGIISFKGLDIQVGKDSQWWGPGYHGAILLSNNAKPLTMVKITNPEPALLPWVLRHLGPTRFVLFVSRLEEDRHVPEPYFWGMRLNFKPLPYLEIGLQRTALLGGKGRSEDLNTWWKSFTGKGENEPGVEAGDQRAGGDIKITVPWSIQPFQVYMEVDGEDEAGGLPYKWAYLTGLYLPRIIDLNIMSLRLEYSYNHISGHPDVWYRHHIYRSGYTYHSRIIGHHMGTDSEDLYGELSFLLPVRSIKINLWFDLERHKLSEPEKPESREYGMKLEGKISPEIMFGASYRYIDLDKALGKDTQAISTELRFLF